MRKIFAAVGFVSFVALAGCASDPEPQEVVVAFVVDRLPADFPIEPHFYCILDDGAGDGSGFVSGYRGTEHVDSEVYAETALLRLSVVRDFVELETAPMFDLRDRGSERSMQLKGRDAITYTVSTAEPVLTPWPAITWQQDDATLSILGEGLSDADVLEAALSVRMASADERDTGGFLGGEQCG